MGFKDTFGKDSSGESNLQYDDGAFYYFTFCLLTIISIPILISIFKSVNQFKNQKRNCTC
jgi:hypothetical protein